ncbi:hypothetical protein R1flu_010774 [Riccia fluitans]|uniref:Uncharacterized protein n=1 Tax=Riccia fluitans TaxID=41844 RepID=A0ABD1ZA38_9MARC
MKRPAVNQVSGSPVRRRLRDECSFQGSSSGTTFQASDSSQALQYIVQGCTKISDEVYKLYRSASGSFNLEVVFFHGLQAGDSEDAFIQTWMTREGSRSSFQVRSCPLHQHILCPLDRQSSNFLLLVHFLKEILREEESCGEILCHLQLPLHLVSCGGRLSKVIKLLDLENPKPIKLSLVGMDGIGKSTLAKQILMHVRN